MGDQEIIASDARYGELGQLKHKSGATSTEKSITVELDGEYVNIPSLVKGQKNVEGILNDEPITREQVKIAVDRYIERVRGGAKKSPHYKTVEEAVAAAAARSEDEKSKPYR